MPAVGSRRRRAASARVVLPEPDSPTRARSSPAIEAEADAVDGAGDLAAAPREAVAERALEGEVHGEVADLEEVAGGVRRRRAGGGAHDEPPLRDGVAGDDVAGRRASWGRAAQASKQCGQRARRRSR